MVIAPDLHTAGQWSIDHGRVRAVRNIIHAEDQTQHWVDRSHATGSTSDLPDILAGTPFVGMASYLIRNSSIGRHLNRWSVTTW